MKFAQRIDRLGTETAFDVLAKVVKLRGKGKDIISFAIGEPDFDTPEHIKAAGIKAIQDDLTHYGPSQGRQDLREVLAKDAGALRNISISPDEVVVTPGAKPIIFHSILSIVDEGDEVIYPNPGFPIYESLINFVGAKPVPLPLEESEEFRFDSNVLREIVNEKTKMIIINSPQNPTGSMLNMENLEAIRDLAQKYDFWVMSDEVYSRLAYDGDFLSIASLPGMKERTIIIDGFSKTYSMTGWRLGYGITTPKLAGHIARLITNSDSCTCTFTQVAGIAAVSGTQEPSDMMAQSFKERRDLIVEGLNSIPGISCVMPKGAFYVFPNVTQACAKMGFASSKEFQNYLLEEAGVAVLGRTCFGSKNTGETEEYIRLSYATSKEGIEGGLERIRKAVGSYV